MIISECVKFFQKICPKMDSDIKKGTFWLDVAGAIMALIMVYFLAYGYLHLAMHYKYLVMGGCCVYAGLMALVVLNAINCDCGCSLRKE